MTNMKTQVKRFTALTLVWVIVTSCFVSSFSFFVNAEEIVTETATQKIEDFVVSVVSGAVNKGSAAAPDYYWNLEDEIKYQIDYNTSGEGELAAESVQFIIPKHIIKNRNGEYADIFEIAVPDVSEVSNDDAENEFVFTERQNDILVYNRIGISAAQKGSVQFSYKPSQSTFDYEDMSLTDSVNVQLNINKSESERLHTEAVVPEVRIDTSAVIRSVKKELSGTYDTWNNSWGNAAELGIDHPNDYIYLIWQISTKVKATQPYTLYYYDTVTGDFGDASAVGISNNVSNSYSTDMHSGVLRKTEPDTIYNFVITKHLKSTYEPHETYKIKNRINVEVIPIDGKDGKTSASTTAEYTYSQPKPDYPIGVFNFWKYNNYSYYNNDRIYNSNIMNYQLDEFKNHFINDIQDRMIYKLVMVGFPYPWTLEDGFLPPDVDHYGVKKVTYVMTDDVFFFRDTVTAYHDYDTMDTGYVVPPGTEQLDADDFEITNVSYSLNIKDAEWDTTALHFVQVNPAFKSGDDVYFYAKFGKDTTFRPVGIFHLDQRKGEILSDKVTKLSVNNITFAPDAQCVGYKIVISNAYYNTLLNVYPSCRIKHSERIHRLINGAYASGEKRAWLTNIANVKIYKSEDEASANDGNKIFDKSEYARNYIIGYEKESQIEKTNTFMRNDKTKRTVTLGWNVEVDEHYMTQDGLKYVPQESGMFYDLLPLGGDLIPSTVTVSANGNTLRDSQYDVSTIVNYRNSGRTLLIVKVKESTSEKYTLMYSTLHSWESLIDYGDTVRNSVAYETGNDRIAGGYPDNGGGIRDSSFMRDLDVNTNERKFLYAEQSRVVKILLAVNSGLFKQVKSDSDSGFAKSAIVYQNQQYIYRLRYETDFLTKSKNMILFDNLDNYENPNTGVTSQWQGTLESVDVSQPVSKGVAPVIYLSELNVDTSDPDNRNLSNRNIWKPKNQFGDISKARSIAVDMSKDKSGNDFVLDAGKSVVVLLYMRSPSAEPDVELPQDQIAAHAYNDTSISSRLVSIVSGSYSEDKLIEWGYDTVELRIMCDIPILKVDETDHTTPVSGIYFRLQGISDYGTNVDIELESDNEGRLTFKNIEKGHYELIESKGSRDYRRIVEASDVEITSDGKVLINGAELGDGTRYVINDPPRIHADIMFNKRDSVNKRKPVAGVKYKLSGRSEYGNNILMYAQSDENGTVIFEDVELGRNYKLVEVSTVPGYILDNTEYSVVVDDNGNFGITPSTMEKNGSLTLYNEPLHSFTLQKIDFTTGKALGGAKFNLSGVSDYGTEFNVTGTANETTGRLSFNDLEKGTYVLQEIEQPDGYFIDDTKRIVTITEDGEITISGLEKNETGNFIVDNKKNGTVTITKLWVDKKANNDRDVPVIHLSSERKKSQATFRPTINRYYSALYPYAVSQNGFTNVSQVKRFMQLPESGVQPDPDRVFRMDDNKTDLPIYGWFDSRNGTLYWWSDAQEVFMPKNSESFFRGMNNLTVVDFSGISTSRVKNMSYMFYDCSALTTLDVSGFDTSKVTDMRYMFYGCSGLTALNVNDFDTSNVTDMSYMLSGCTALTSLSVSGFDTSKVTDMSSMFYNCQKLTTLNVSGFDTPNVTNMSSMFYNCRKLTTLNVSSFDTSNVTDMSYMFYYCSGLTTLDVSGFDTSKVTDMRYMFYNCRSLTTLDVSGFDTANVTDMSFMFYYCQKLTTLDVSGFDTSNVTDMRFMFYGCSGLTTLDVSGFDMSNVTDMRYMFSDCSGLTTLNVSGFDMSNVTDMSEMFYNCQKLTTLNLSGLDTSNVTDMSEMFRGCSNLTTLNLSGLDTSKVTDMSYMFYDCQKLTTLNLSGLDTSNVTDMSDMFGNCQKLTTLNLSGFDTSKVTNMRSMFYNCQKLTTLNLSGFDTSNVTDMSSMFYYCSGLTSLDVSNFDTIHVTNMSDMFARCSNLRFIDVSGFDTSNVTNMTRMFQYCSGLTTLNVSGFDTSKVTEMRVMFSGCSRLTSLDLSGFDTSNVTDMSYMFESCRSLRTLNVSGFDTSKVTDMGNMFSGCSGLTSLDLSDFNTSKVTYMSSMFYNCSGLTSLNISGFDTSKVTSMSSMFQLCSGLTSLDLSGFDTTHVTSMAQMFQLCSGLTTLDLSSFDTSMVTSMSDMFYNCSKLTTIIANSWYIGNENRPANMFFGCIRLVGGNGTRYSESNINKTYARIDTVETPGYFTEPLQVSQKKTVYLAGLRDYIRNNRSSLTEFRPYDGGQESVPDTAVRIDGGTTAYSAYAWLDGTTMYWWSDAEITYLPNSCSSLFSDCNRLVTVDLSGLDSSHVTGMSHMFNNCSVLTSLDLSGFDTSNVTYMDYMFNNCSGLTSLDLSGFDTSIVTNMSYMFYNCQKLKTLNISGFDTSKVTDMRYMFYNCQKLTTLDVSGFNTSKVRYMSYMFNGCSGLTTLDVSGFDTSKVTDMNNMFYNCRKLTTLDVSGFDTANVTNMSYMFNGCSGLTTLDVSGFDTSKVTNMNNMFYNCQKLTTLDVSNFDTSKVTYMSYMFSGCSGLTTLDVSNFDTSNVINISYMFCNCQKLTTLDVSGFVTSKVTNMSSMFSGCSGLTALDVSGFVTANVTNMSYMFRGCSGLTALDVTGFDTANVTNMSYMFRDCSGLTALDVSGFDTSKVTDMNNMFYNCSGLTTLDVSGFDTATVTNMSYMFSGCSGLTALDVSGFDTSKVTSMSYMFYNCSGLTTLDVSGFGTANVTNMSYMFNNCSGLTTLDVSGFGTANVTNMSYMFNGCSKLTTIYVLEELWKTDNVTSGNNMFTGCTAICGEKGTTYNSSHTDKTYARIDAPENSKPGYLTQKEIESDETDEQTESEEGVHYITDMTLPDGLRMADGSSTGGAKCVLNKDADTNTWTYTFTGINDTVEYYVWEDDLEGYTGTATKYHPGIVEEGAFTITNTNPDSPKYGALKLKKTVNAEEGTLDESDLVRKFTFTVTLTDENNKPVTGSTFYGNTPFMNGVAVIKLSASDGETVFTDIPENWHYSITETAEEGYESTVASGNAKGTIEADTIKSVVFNNTRKHEETIPDVSFSIKKLVTGNVIDPNEQYTFFVDLSGLRAKGTYSYVCGDGSSKEFTATQSGSAYIELDLKKDEVATFTVPENTNYTVTEQAGQYTSSYQIVDAAGKGLINNSSAYNTIENTTLSTETETADAGEMIEITFTNVKNVTQNLTLSKKLLNASDDNIDKFDFTLNITGLTSGTILQSSIGRLVVTDGQITIEFSLASGETVEIYDIPVGAVYEVIEAESDYQASYEIKHNNSVVYHGSNQAPNHSLSTGERSIQVGADPEVIFTNRKIACDITITKRIDMTYGNLLEYEYRTQGFEFEVELNGLSGSQLKYNEIMTELFDKDTTGSVKKTLAEVMGLNEQEGQQLVDSAVFSITLHHGESFKIRNLPYGATCKVTERASEDYYASYIVKSNTEAELQARPGSNEAKNTALSLNAAERIDTNDTDIEFVFTNRYEFKPYELPAAGTHDDRLKIVFLIFGMLTFAMTYYCVNRRKHKKSGTK